MLDSHFESSYLSILENYCNANSRQSRLIGLIYGNAPVATLSDSEGDLMKHTGPVSGDRGEITVGLVTIHLSS